MEFSEKTIRKETIFDGTLVHLEKHTIQTVDGHEATREVIHHQPAAAIIAFDDAGRLVLVRQYRKAIERPILEIPAGLIEAGEDPDAAAKRELEEETKLQADHWQTLPGFYVSPGYLDEYLHLYAASGLHTVAHPKAADADEFIEVEHYTLAECQAAIDSGEICDAKTIFAVAYGKLRQAGALDA